MTIGDRQDLPAIAGDIEDGTFVIEGEPNSSAAVLSALGLAERDFAHYDRFCREIENVYSARSLMIGTVSALGATDQEYDLFWASMEILKPAIYSKAPAVVAKPRYSDANNTDKAVADVIERVVNSEFERSDIDQVMLGVRDDLALTNRGVAWVRYEDDDEKRVWTEYLDRSDFRHEPARRWAEVGWVARAGWMTQPEMAKRFRESSGLAYQEADYRVRRGQAADESHDHTLKAQVWEVWHKSDNRVYWVTEGVDVMLDEGEPHLDLDNFFPCPRPAYGFLRSRTLIPVPDYTRYLNHLEQINLLTGRIYDLLECVKLRGLIPAGGDVGSAIETAIAENDSAMFIPVPGAALMASGGAASFVQFLPLVEVSTAIAGLIEARNQLFNDFYQLSGISDIMRGATESEETLGAQRLKSQYGSIRVRDKIDQIVRLARDLARISVEVICDNFTQADLLEVSQMDFPTKAEVKKSLKELEGQAKSELDALFAQAEEAGRAQEVADPAQAAEVLKAAQSEIIQKYAPKIQELQNAVVIEDVMESIKDRRSRNLVIDIETDSTVMTDEAQEKASRSEFLQAFASASANLQPLIAAGEAGAALAGAMMKFALQPYRVDRQLDSMIDDFVREAPQMAANAQGQEGESADLIAAQNKLAEAEQMKAQAAMASVQARAAQAEADNQRKMAEMQVKQQNDMQKAQGEADKLRLQLEKQMQEGAAKDAETEAKINLLTAQTAKILESIGLDARKQDLAEYQAAEATRQKQVDTAIGLERQATDDQFRARGEDRADQGEQRADRGDERADQQFQREAQEVPE